MIPFQTMFLRLFAEQTGADFHVPKQKGPLCFSMSVHDLFMWMLTRVELRIDSHAHTIEN